MSRSDLNGREIKLIRLKLGWSQERLARELGVSFCTVNRWERGRCRPSLMAARNIKRLVTGKGDVNRRSSLRRAISLPMIVKRVRETYDIFEAYSDNISVGGLMFQTSNELDKGEMLDINMIDGKGKDLARVLSDVRWKKKRGDLTTVGVRFVEFKKGDARKTVYSAL